MTDEEVYAHLHAIFGAEVRLQTDSTCCVGTRTALDLLQRKKILFLDDKTKVAFSNGVMVNASFSLC
jgi:hypothetical protein